MITLDQHQGSFLGKKHVKTLLQSPKYEKTTQVVVKTKYEILVTQQEEVSGSFPSSSRHLDFCTPDIISLIHPKQCLLFHKWEICDHPDVAKLQVSNSTCYWPCWLVANNIFSSAFIAIFFLLLVNLLVLFFLKLYFIHLKVSKRS